MMNLLHPPAEPDTATRVLLLAFALANAVLYSSLLPLWEGFDEPFHYGYVQHLSASRALPVLGETRISQEVWDFRQLCPTSHVIAHAWPELQTYDRYFALSPATRAHQRTALEAIPRAGSVASPQTNYEAQQAPLAYAALAVPDLLLSSVPLTTRILWLRIFAALLALLVTYLAAACLFRTLGLPPCYQAVGLYCIFACQMYWATVAHVSNDGLGVAVSIWFFAAATAFSKQPDRSRALRLALATSLGLLTKAYFLPLLAFAACLVAYRRARAIPAFAAVVALAAGPWYVRNLVLYHNLSGLLMASAGITPRQVAASLARVDWGRTIPYMLRATLWTGNNSFTSFSAVTLNCLLVLLAAGVGMYAVDAIRRRGIYTGERTLMGGIAVYVAAVIYVVGNDVIFLHGTSAGASPWYTEVLLAPVLAVAFLGMGRTRKWGGPAAMATVLLWTYISIATYLVKLIPLYGGYGEGRTTLKGTIQWYVSRHHELTSMLSTISLAPPVLIYLETGAVTGLAVALATRLILRLTAD